MSATVLSLAKAQLAGGVGHSSSWSCCTCRNCGIEYRIEDGLDPCAFCDDCKDTVLDRLAKKVVHRRVCPVANLRLRGRGLS